MNDLQLILIAGTGQNVGKTTLACRLIQQLAKNGMVNAMKVAGHRHQLTSLQPVIYRGEGLVISIETNHASAKDSSRYLRAGAHRSYFVLCNESGIDELTHWINENLQGWLVCESGIVGRTMIPDFAFFVKGEEPKKQAPWRFDYQTVRYINEEFFPSAETLLKLK